VAIGISQTQAEPTAAAARQARRRQVVIDEALDRAIEITSELGVGALTISEMARRMGVRGPSLYKYFDSLHAVYDALFARGQAANASAVDDAIASIPPGVERIRAGVRATVRWCVANPALAQLLYWRVVPGFEPSRETFSAGVQAVADVRAELAESVRREQLHPRADSDEALRLLTVQISGLVTQQMANEPTGTYDTGRYTSLTDEVIDMFLGHYRPHDRARRR
jgi:AcrR family transcriptional regulator